MHGNHETLRLRLRELIEMHSELTVSELGRRIGHKTGTAISALISDAKSARDDMRLSTFLRICNVLAKAYEGRATSYHIAVYLLGIPIGEKEKPACLNDIELKVLHPGTEGAQNQPS